MSSPRKRVLVLNWRDPWHPEGGGSEIYVTEVARRLHAAGTGVTVFSARYPGPRPPRPATGSATCGEAGTSPSTSGRRSCC